MTCHCERSEAIPRPAPQARPRLHANTTSATADLRRVPFTVTQPFISLSRHREDLSLRGPVITKGRHCERSEAIWRRTPHRQ
jgi:hypothetical protein